MLLVGRPLGVDISDEAIERAQSKTDNKTEFQQGDINHRQLSRQFDVIVFAEILYSLDQPADMLKLYERYLKANGVFIVGL